MILMFLELNDIVMLKKVKDFFIGLGIVDVPTALTLLLGILLFLYFSWVIRGSGVIMNGAGIGGLTEI